MFPKLLIGHPTIHLNVVHSTNEYAKDLLSKTKPENGCAILADEQLKGKGQFGNTWFSDKGKNVLVSVIIYPNNLMLEHRFYLAMSTALAIRDCLADFLPDKPVQIKWPNDILVNSKKIAGILIENSIEGKHITNSIVGMGINVNQKSFEGLPMACSIATQLLNEVSLDDVIRHLFENMNYYFNLLLQEEFAYLNMLYLAHLLNYNIKATYRIDGNKTEGIIRGVSSEGFLQMEINGVQRTFDLKQITYCFEA